VSDDKVRLWRTHEVVAPVDADLGRPEWHEDRVADESYAYPDSEWIARPVADDDAREERLKRAEEQRDALALVVLHESIDFREVEAAKERVRDAKKKAVEDDPAVAKAALALKKAKAALKKSAAEVIAAEKAAKGDVRALVEAKDETERGIVGALKTGKVPSPLIVDEK